MKFTAQQIADVLEGTVNGNPNEEVFKLSKIEEGETGGLTFLSNPKYTSYIYTTKASVAIVSRTFQPNKPITPTLIKVEDPYASFTKILHFYNEVKNNKQGREIPNLISASAKVGENEYIGAFSHIGEHVIIGNNVKIYPNTFIGDNCKIGDNTIIFSGVKIYSETVIGNNCKIHANTIIGSDGFGFVPNKNGEFEAIPQIGNVVIGDCVDIGASTTIDRATMGSTIIRKGVKLDNQIQIAHNVEIGMNTVIASQTGIAGSTKVGQGCMIGGQVGIGGHLKIEDNVKILAKAGVTKNIKAGSVINGNPAINAIQHNKNNVYLKNLSKLIERVEKIEKGIYTQNQLQNE